MPSDWAMASMMSQLYTSGQGSEGASNWKRKHIYLNWMSKVRKLYQYISAWRNPKSALKKRNILTDVTYHGICVGNMAWLPVWNKALWQVVLSFLLNQKSVLLSAFLLRRQVSTYLNILPHLFTFPISQTQIFNPKRLGIEWKTQFCLVIHFWGLGLTNTLQRNEYIL